VFGARLTRSFGNSLVVTEKDYLNALTQPHPTAKRVALDDPDVAEKGFRNGKYGQHSKAPLAPSERWFNT
jgi:hypothetical protein